MAKCGSLESTCRSTTVPNTLFPSPRNTGHRQLSPVDLLFGKIQQHPLQRPREPAHAAAIGRIGEHVSIADQGGHASLEHVFAVPLVLPFRPLLDALVIADQDASP